MSIEKMKLALNALELAGGNLCEALHHPKKLQHGIGEPCPAVAKYDKAITALRQAIEQAEKQEPYKFAMEVECTNCGTKQSGILTFSPPPRQPLTDEEILILNNPNWDKGGEEQLIAAPDEEIIEFARAIEAAHDIKGEA